MPRNWLRLMKSSMQKLTGHFSTNRMVAEYAEGFYLPSLRAAFRGHYDPYEREMVIGFRCAKSP